MGGILCFFSETATGLGNKILEMQVRTCKNVDSTITVLIPTPLKYHRRNLTKLRINYKKKEKEKTHRLIDSDRKRWLKKKKREKVSQLSQRFQYESLCYQ